MAIPKGLWDLTASSPGWFDETQSPEGWFDPDLVDSTGPQIYDDSVTESSTLSDNISNVTTNYTGISLTETSTLTDTTDATLVAELHIMILLQKHLHLLIQMVPLQIILA